MATLAEHRKARFNYTILGAYEAGIELKGYEVKAVKAGRMNLGGAFGIVRGNEIWLLNADVSPYQPGNTPKEYESSRPRRLLLRASEIRELIGKMKERGLTLLPLRAYTKGNLVKIELGLGRGKRGPDKREAIKKRETQREIGRTLKM
ncbi:MAG: SsrA-binding protein SmpB [bacterium]|nr:SsrA-binding protein SmpB [bacterium]